MGFIGNGCHCLFDGERGVGVRLGLIGPPLGELSTELEGVGPGLELILGPGPISFGLTDAVGSLSRWPPPSAGVVGRVCLGLDLRHGHGPPEPSAYRKAQKQSKHQWAQNSFEAVAREWLAKHSPNWTTGHADRTRRELEQNVFPWIGARPIADLTAPDLLAVVRRIEERGLLNMAHGNLQMCGRVWRYAVATGRAERDVSWDLRGALPPAKVSHFAAITEPKQVGPLLRVLDGYRGTLPVRCALRLAPLVFVRPGELRKAEWAGIDLEGGEWRYTVTKTGTPHIVPLARQSVEILRELHPLTGHGRCVPQCPLSAPGAADERRDSVGSPACLGHPSGSYDDAWLPCDGKSHSG